MPKLKGCTTRARQARPAPPHPCHLRSTTPTSTWAIQGTPMISQDEDDYEHSSPASNTCQQWKVCTIMQDYLFHMMDIPGLTKPSSNQQAAARKYPLQFLCDFVSAVLNDKTGNLLEYHHLLKHPKYKDIWSKSFETGIRRIATTTKTIAFMSKDMNRRKDITYGQIVCDYRSEKKDPYCTRIMMGGNLIKTTPMTLAHPQPIFSQSR